MSASLVRATVRAVNKRKLLPTRAALTLTPAAVSKIRLLLQEKPEYIGLKVGVRTRGCNGLTYTLEYTMDKEKSDEEVLQDGKHFSSSLSFLFISLLVLIQPYEASNTLCPLTTLSSVSVVSPAMSFNAGFIRPRI
ncbi:Iron-sulfur cluster assembly 1 mitochondrial [Xenotaenia resolanae]|uniref:Iron-sulfur cluster assembly 1 mitochondrial n=1 Tax=Xenotaenia resolanae TaxID=208358 RepID=A0ABV0WQQ9_9TELE